MTPILQNKAPKKANATNASALTRRRCPLIRSLSAPASLPLPKQHEVVYYQSMGLSGRGRIDFRNTHGRPTRRWVEYRLQILGLLRSLSIFSVQDALMPSLRYPWSRTPTHRDDSKPRPAVPASVNARPRNVDAGCPEMRRSDPPQAEKALQLLRRLAAVVVVLQVGLGDLEVIARSNLHTRDTVATCVNEGRSIEETIWRARVHQQALRFAINFPNPE